MNFIKQQKQLMRVVEEHQGQSDQFVLRRELRDGQVRMLAFLYNADYEIAAEKFDQKYAVYSELKNIQNNQNIKSEQVKRIFLALSEKVHQRILRQQIECDKALNKLETLWEVRKIEPFHRYYFEKYIYSTYLQNVHTLVKRQDTLIRQEQHVYFSILRAIWARQACINHIQRQLKQLNPEDMYEHFNTVRERAVQRNRKIQQRQYKVHGYRALYRLDYKEATLDRTKMEDFFEDVHNYRKLTVHLVELIIKWKQYMWSLTHDLKKRKQRIEYYYQENNQLLRMLNDTQFVAHSFLSNFFTFSSRNDPFFLKPILTLQKKQEQHDQPTFEELQLKQLIQVQPIYLPKIIAAVQELHNQLETNLRNRKVYSQFALNKVKSMSLDHHSKAQQEKTPVKRIQLEAIGGNRSTNFQSSPSIRLPRHISLMKSNVTIRKSSPMVRQISRKTISSNNPEAPNPFKMIESEKLQSIKEEVFRKVKEQLEFETKKSLLKSKQFEQLIDMEVKTSMNELLQKQKKQLKQAVWEVSPVSYRQEQIGSYLAYIYKFIPVNHLSLQKTQKELASIIADLQYCYFLKIHRGNDQISHVLGRVNRQIKGYKSIQIMFVAFKHTQLIEKIILRTVQFIWKYQNAKEVVFLFTTNTSENEQFIHQLKQKLQTYCSVIEKKIRNQKQFRYVFIKKGVNQNYVYNPFPEHLHFKLYSLLTTEPLQHNSVNDSPIASLHYEYMVIEALKRFTNSEDFKILRDTFKPKDRFRNLLTQLLELQCHKNNEEELAQIRAESITDLNNQLAVLKKPTLQLSDITKVNCLRMLVFQMTLIPAYSLKVLSDWKGQKIHRYHIHQSIKCYTDDEQTQFFMLDIQDNHHLKILVFKASTYLEMHNKSLYGYLYKKSEKIASEPVSKFVENFWISMIRHPYNPNQQEQLSLKTSYCPEFETINKEMYIGESLDWFTDIQIQNGLKYQIQKGDVVMPKPMGVGVVTSSGGLLYCRVIM